MSEVALIGDVDCVQVIHVAHPHDICFELPVSGLRLWW
jgi:hypothetical protein